MVSNFAKFARTNKSLIVFSNSFDHIEVFKHFYNERVKPNEFGFIKINSERICLLHEDLNCDLIKFPSVQILRYFTATLVGSIVCCLTKEESSGCPASPQRLPVVNNSTVLSDFKSGNNSESA